MPLDILDLDMMLDQQQQLEQQPQQPQTNGVSGKQGVHATQSQKVTLPPTAGGVAAKTGATAAVSFTGQPPAVRRVNPLAGPPSSS